MKDAACTAVFGMRGSGKTTRAKILIGQSRRVVVFDPMGEYSQRGFFRCTSLIQVRDRLKAGWRAGFKIAYVPRGDYPRMLHGLAYLLHHAQAPYWQGRDRRKILLVVEEMNLGYPASKLPAAYFGMSRITLQGRHRGIEIVGISQRPALVSADFRGSVAETFVFPLATGHDFKAIAEIYGRRHDVVLKALVTHNFIHFAAGKARAGKNPPLRRQSALSS